MVDSKVVDCNVSFGVWPFQRLPFHTVPELDSHLAANGIERALVSHLGAVFDADPDGYNQELIDATSNSARLFPVPVINLRLPATAWKKDLEKYARHASVRAVKIYPTFHNYRLNTRPVFQLIEQLEQKGLRLIVCMRMEDERTQYFGLKIKGLPVKEIVRLHRRYPELPFLCQNVYLPEAREIGDETSLVYVDTAFSEWLFTAQELRKHLDAERIFLGTHTPLFYTGAGIAKLRDSLLPDEEKKLILGENSQRFFGL